jgi:hypothetical protein
MSVEGPAATDYGEPSLSTAATVVQMLTDPRLSQAMYTAAQLRLADVVLQLGRGSTVSLADLATELRLDPSALRQLLCGLTSAGIFRQDNDHEGGRYGLNPLARHLLSEAPWSLRSAVLVYGEEMTLARQGTPAAAVAPRARLDITPVVGGQAVSAFATITVRSM